MTATLESVGAVPASEFDSRGLARSIPLRGRREQEAADAAARYRRQHMPYSEEASA